MSLGKKLATLINATLRGGLPQRQRFRINEDDPDGQLKAIREALAAVEIQERAVAEKLKETETKLETALDEGDRDEVVNQRRLARELEAQLQTQSTEAITLSEKLAAIEAVLTEQRAEVEQDIQENQAQLDQQTQLDQIKGNQPSEDIDNTNNNDEDLDARKSRLSG